MVRTTKLITFQKSMLAIGTVINIQVVAYEEDRRAVLEDINRAFSIFTISSIVLAVSALILKS